MPAAVPPDIVSCTLYAPNATEPVLRCPDGDGWDCLRVPGFAVCEKKSNLLRDPGCAHVSPAACRFPRCVTQYAGSCIFTPLLIWVILKIRWRKKVDPLGTRAGNLLAVLVCSAPFPL
jgi:hypothetical protein